MNTGERVGSLTCDDIGDGTGDDTDEDTGEDTGLLPGHTTPSDNPNGSELNSQIVLTIQ